MISSLAEGAGVLPPPPDPSIFRGSRSEFAALLR
jgi:hypothetical protein